MRKLILTLPYVRIYFDGVIAQDKKKYIYDSTIKYIEDLFQQQNIRSMANTEHVKGKMLEYKWCTN